MKLITIIPIIALNCFAGGTMDFSGKLRNFDKDRVDVEDNFKIYTLDRKKLGLQQDKKIAKIKSGEDLNLVIPFDAVLNVKKVNK